MCECCSLVYIMTSMLWWCLFMGSAITTLGTLQYTTGIHSYMLLTVARLHSSAINSHIGRVFIIIIITTWAHNTISARFVSEDKDAQQQVLGLLRKVTQEWRGQQVTLTQGADGQEWGSSTGSTKGQVTNGSSKAYYTRNYEPRYTLH